MGEGLGLHASWDEPDYKRCVTFYPRGLFILTKLRGHDAAKLREMLGDPYRDKERPPDDITKFEWQTILAYMGASPRKSRTCRRGWGGNGSRRALGGAPGRPCLPTWVDGVISKHE